MSVNNGTSKILSTRLCTISAVLALSALPAHSLDHGHSSPPAALRGIVAKLGSDPDKPAAGFDQLAAATHQSVGLLAAQLQTLPRKTFFENKKTTQSRHIIACLRALRYMTGQTFSATTSEKLSSDEKQFLAFDKTPGDQNPKNKIHFFGVWMSRNAEIIAPQDAQRKIIAQWRQFANTEGATFKYKPAKSAAKSMDQWFWN